MTTITQLMEELAALGWSDRAGAHRDAQHALMRVESPAALLESVRNVDPLARELDRSVEKTTHFKWFVASGPDRNFELWVHDYKPVEQRRTGHAVVAHNHRFWFTSLLLRGGFRSTRFELVSPDSAELQETSALTLNAGDTYVVDPSEIHALTDIQEGTLTLLVQSNSVRSFSDVYENGRVTRYYDLAAQFDSFVTTTSELPDFASAGRRHHFTG